MSEFSKNIEAYAAIKRLMSCNKLSPGQKLIYRDLEEQLGMSKTPIINALMKLEQEGLVASKRNRGFYVKQLGSTEIIDIFQLRQRLEEIAIEFAIANYKKGDLKILKGKINDYNNEISKIYDTRRAELDLEFHLYIAKMGGNNFLVSILRQFYDRVYFSLPFNYLSPHIEQFKNDHLALFDAIKHRNLKRAKMIMKVHSETGIRACVQFATEGG